jgi:catechol 2,3-dioxygenase-like lactoylglutathione lyase family enzyme
MIDHTGVNVSDFEASKRFYAAALAPFGYELLLEFHGSVASFGVQRKPDFWIARGEPNTSSIHVAFRADTRQKVDEF